MGFQDLSVEAPYAWSYLVSSLHVLRESPNNHDDQRFEKELVGIDLLPPTLACDWRRGHRYLLNEPEEADKNAAMDEHFSASGV